MFSWNFHAFSMTQHTLAIWSLGPLPFLNPAYTKCFLGNPNFLKKITSLSILLFSFISLHLSLKKAFFILLAILWNSAFKWVYLSLSRFSSFLSSFVRPPQATILPSCISFSWGWFWSPPVQHYEPPSIVLQALCLPELIPWIYSSLPLYNHMGFDLGHTWMAYRFSLLSSV